MSISRIVKSELKKEFPNSKFSVISDYNSLTIKILESNIDFGTTDEQVNHYWIERNYKDNLPAKNFLLKIMEIMNSIHPQETINHDSDYGNIPNYYLTLKIGNWDKHYKQLAA